MDFARVHEEAGDIMVTHSKPSGKIAGNVTCDLHIEHLTWRCSWYTFTSDSKVNFRVGKCIGLFRCAQKQFDSVTDVKHSSWEHVRELTATDLENIVQKLVKTEYQKGETAYMIICLKIFAIV